MLCRISSYASRLKLHNSPQHYLHQKQLSAKLFSGQRRQAFITKEPLPTLPPPTYWLSFGSRGPRWSLQKYKGMYIFFSLLGPR